MRRRPSSQCWRASCTSTTLAIIGAPFNGSRWRRRRMHERGPCILRPAAFSPGYIRAAAVPRPERRGVDEDSVAERVPGPCEREGRVGVQALEAAHPPGTADSTRQLRAELALLVMCAGEARPELGVGGSSSRPALDAARGFEPRKLRAEVRTREPEL